MTAAEEAAGIARATHGSDLLPLCLTRELPNPG